MVVTQLHPIFGSEWLLFMDEHGTFIHKKELLQNQILDAAGLQPIIGSSSDDFSNSVHIPTLTIALIIFTVFVVKEFGKSYSFFSLISTEMPLCHCSLL